MNAIETILIAHPAPLTRRLVGHLLTESYRAEYADTLDEARAVLDAAPVALALVDGATVGPLVRRDATLPIIALVDGGVTAHVAALRTAAMIDGADDAIGTPFEPAELVARVDAVLRRYRRAEAINERAVIRAGDAVLNTTDLKVTVAGKDIPLAGQEMQVLSVLMANAGRIIPRERLMGRVWEDAGAIEDNRLCVLVRRLRKKMGAQCIEGVRGAGYRFVAA